MSMRMRSVVRFGWLAPLLFGLAACSGPGPAQAPAAAPSAGDAPGAATPAPPKVNRVVLALEPQSLESNRPVDGDLAMRLIYERLLDVSTDNGKFVPSLAEKWNLEPDNTSFRFQLRKGVQFHGGAGEFAATDVKGTYEMIAASDATGTTPTYVKQTVREMEVVNPNEIIFRMKTPDSQFFEYISTQGQGSEVVSKKDLDQRGMPKLIDRPLAGTGPYEYLAREVGQYIRYKRVDYKHWKLTPDFPELELRWVKEPSTRLAALLTQEVHLASLPEDLLQQAQKQGMTSIRGRVAAFRAVLNFHCCLAKDPWDPSAGYVNPNTPLADVRIRKALNKAINRDEMNKALFGGKGEVIYNNPYHPTRPGWNPEWQQRFQEAYGFDPAAAKALVAQAGYGPGNPLKVNLVLQPARGLAGAADVVEAVGGYWRALGADVSLITVTSTNDLRNGPMDNHVVIWATSASMWAGTANYGTALIESNRIFGYGMPDADLVLKQIVGTLDPEKADPLWRQMGNIWFDKYKFIPLHYLPVEIAANPKVVAGYVFPGSISTNWTHLQNLKAAR